MKCPIDAAELKNVRRHRMQVAECPKCKGMWLTPLQLDQLEDLKFNVDHLKGSLLVSSVETSLPCPVCNAHLYEFKYRLHLLRLDHCPKQQGFWLDRSEDKRVLEIMAQRRKDMYRVNDAETSWEKFMLDLRGYMFSQDPRSLTDKRKTEDAGLPPHIDARDPAVPYKPPKLPSTCPRCGGPMNSMSVIEDAAHQYICGWCHAILQTPK